MIDPRPFTRESIVHTIANHAREFDVFPVPSADELGAHLGDGVLTNASVAIINAGFALLSDHWVSREIVAIKARLPETPLIVLCDSEDMSEVVKALGYGVRGYIPTTFSPRVAIEAIRLVYAGGTFIPASALKHAGNGHRQSAALSQDEADCEVSEPSQPDAATADKAGMQGEILRGLTPRQRQVLHLLCEGQANKNIAYALHMQEGTVKVHVRQIMKKLKATNRTQVAFLANRQWASDKART